VVIVHAGGGVALDLAAFVDSVDNVFLYKVRF
jgi:hypothetical protein